MPRGHMGMNNYRQIRQSQMDESLERFYFFINKEWERILEKNAEKGFDLVQGSCIDELFDASCEQQDNLLNNLLSSEEQHLRNIDEEVVTSEHFTDLTEDLTNFWRKCYLGIQSKVRQFVPANIVSEISDWACEMPTLDSVMRRIKIMEKKYNDGLLKTSAAHTIINVGKNEGVINTGHIYSTVQGKIVQINKESNDIVLNSINSLLTAINQMTINESAKLEYLKNIDFLVSQYALPKEQKNSFLIKTVLQTLSTSADLISIWDKYGALITAGFMKLLQ